MSAARWWPQFAGALFSAVGLYALSRVHYLLFHLLVEIFTIIVAGAIFLLFWNAREQVRNHFLHLTGIGYPCIALIDLIHTLAYKGMPIFPPDANLPTQLWIAARALQAGLLLAAAGGYGRRLKDGTILALCLAAATVLLAAIFSGHFPDCFIEGTGLTPFKVVSEYLISIVLALALVQLVRRRGDFDQAVFRLLAASLLAAIASELAFTTYVSVYGAANMLGHYLKLLAFYLLYRAIVVTGVREPLRLLFRELQQTQTELATVNASLEEKIARRTTELAASNASLRAEIARRETVEQQLRADEERLARLAAIVEASDAAIISKSLDGTVLTWNPGAEEIYGYCAAEMIGRSITVIIPPERLDEYRTNMTQIGLGERIAHFRTERLHRDGRRLCTSLSIFPLHDNAGQVIGASTIARDVTRQQQAEEEIARLKNYLANIVNSMPALLVAIDQQQRVTQWNSQAATVTGISADRAIGAPLATLLPDFAPWIDALLPEVEQHHPAACEKLLLEQAGERRFFDLMLYPLATNCVSGAVVRIDDVTRRARMEELMIQTEKMMSLGGLAAGMAHEINNPLGIVSQAAQTIERRLDPALDSNLAVAVRLGLDLQCLTRYLEERQIKEMLSAIAVGVERAGQIVSGMLQFSRQSSGDRAPTSLTDLIEHAVALAGRDYDLKKRFDFRAIEIVRDIPSDFPPVPVVAIEIEQVLLNLLRNAAQAMAANPPERPPRIELRLRRESDWAVIEIADNGPGMGEEVRQRIFEPFFTTKEAGVGTGLGLSVSRMIVTQNHHGRIEVASTPGNGACFTVRLPLSAAARDGGAKEADRTSNPAYPPPEGS